jgi:hypothetical protein
MTTGQAQLGTLAGLKLGHSIFKIGNGRFGLNLPTGYLNR